MLEFSIVTISIFVSTLNEITKSITKGVFNKEINRFIPLFSIAYGIILALAAFYTGLESFGNNIIEAIFIGLSSGAAATGYHQVGKQLFKQESIIPTISESELSDKVEEILNEEEEIQPEDTTVEDVPEVEDANVSNEDTEVSEILGTEENVLDYTEGE